MKSTIKTALICTLALGIVTAPAAAFDKKKSKKSKNASVATVVPESGREARGKEDSPKDDKKKEDQRTRELLVKVETGEVDGLSVKVVKVQGANQLEAVDAATEFKKGDSLKVAFQSNFDGYIYILNVAPGGKKKILFPYELAEGSDTDNGLSSGKEYMLPRGATIDFDSEVGVEVLQVYFSRDRVKAFDDAIKNSKGVVGTSAASAASELAARTTDNSSKADVKGGITAENIDSALQNGDGDGVRTRKIRLAPGKSQEKVAIPEDNGKPIKMQTGDVAVFEIRLKHI